MNFLFRVTKAEVHKQPMGDRVTLYTDLPHPQYRPATRQPITIEFTCDHDTGVEFVKNTYYITPNHYDFAGNLINGTKK